MDQVQVKRAAFELDQINASEELRLDPAGKLESDGFKRADHASGIFAILWEEDIHVLSGGGVSQQNCAALADEQIVHLVGGAGGGNLNRLVGG